MKLGQKTFFYTMIVSGLVGISLILFLIFFLPGLYLNYQMNKYLESATHYHEQFVSGGDISQNNRISWFGVKIPKGEDRIYLLNAGRELSFLLKDEELKSKIDKIRNFQLGEDSFELKDNQIEAFFNFEKILKSDFLKEYDIQYVKNDMPIEFVQKTSEIHTLKENSLLVENSVNTSEKITYTNFVGITNQEGNLFITLYGEVTPSIDDIKPVIYMSIPVLLLLVLIIGVIGSSIFAKILVRPILVLVNDAHYRQSYGYHQPIPIQSKDEVGELATLLNELYDIQNEQYHALEEESQRKEVFMRAFSHQLKNPIASSLLLIEGMESGIGKYQDRDTYLSVLKTEVQKIQRLVEEVSDFNLALKDMTFQEVDVMKLFVAVQEELNFLIREKKLSIKVSGKLSVSSDPILLYKVLHNLLDNGISYTKEGGFIQIDASKKQFIIRNYPTFIPDEIKSNVFEPLVSSGFRKDSKGLGLYIVKSFCQQLSIELDFAYQDENVVITMKWS